MLQPRVLTIGAAALALFGAGCSTTATIFRSNGPNIESRIVDGDATSLFVQSDNGLVYRVDRRTVGDIDHPGNVHMIVGGLCLAASAFALGASFDDNNLESDRQGMYAMSAIYGGIGLPLALWGGWAFLRSRQADQGREPRPALVMAAPEDVPMNWPPPAPGWTPAPAAAAKTPAPAPVAPAAATPAPAAPTPATLTEPATPPAPAAPAPPP